MRRVVLYTAAGCHLCERARATVASLRGEPPFELEEVDITGDPELEARYRELLPVVEIDGGGRSSTTSRRRAAPRAAPHKLGPRTRACDLSRPQACGLAHSCATVTNSTRRRRVAERLTVGVAARLSRYLQVLTQAKKMGKDRISSQEISDYTNINATQIRRDLSTFGKFGKRGVGYNIDSLLAEIRKILRTQGQHNIALVGAGRLGRRSPSSPIFAEHGINIAAVFDTDPEKVGRTLGGVDGLRLRDLPEASCATRTSSSACSPCRPTPPRRRPTTSSARASRSSSTTPRRSSTSRPT